MRNTMKLVYGLWFMGYGFFRRLRFTIYHIRYTIYLLLLFPKSVYAVDLQKEYAFGSIGSLGEALSFLAPVTFVLGGIIVFIYFLVGAYELIISSGDKGAVQAGKDKMIHAIIGLILLLATFILFRALPYLLRLDNFNIIGF
jgi:hypothetical protein